MDDDIDSEPAAGGSARSPWTKPRALVAMLAVGLLATVGIVVHATPDGPAIGGTTASEGSGDLPVPLPATIKRAAPQASDYVLVSVFRGEAFLSTSDDLVRVVVGVRRPGLGTVTSVETLPDGGGAVVGTEATLRAE
ncbi:hypothetical protein [uncultured Aureimonas sp.]|uniref:hypothetical protein n=1 Tax=uncultured Aureimonas sp. TaxID=1604662 RepID=UPI0025E41AE8|nr:hypothetical protein [uncultured Aureimonas sp.]